MSTHVLSMVVTNTSATTQVLASLAGVAPLEHQLAIQSPIQGTRDNIPKGPDWLDAWLMGALWNVVPSAMDGQLAGRVSWARLHPRCDWAFKQETVEP